MESRKGRGVYFPEIKYVPEGTPEKLVEYLARPDVWSAFEGALERPGRRDHRYMVFDFFSDRPHQVKLSLVQVAEEGEEEGHKHTESQVLILWVCGTGVLRVGGESYDMEAGDLRFVPAGILHAVSASADAMFVSVQNPPIYRKGRLDYVV